MATTVTHLRPAKSFNQEIPKGSPLLDRFSQIRIQVRQIIGDREENCVTEDCHQSANIMYIYNPIALIDSSGVEHPIADLDLTTEQKSAVDGFRQRIFLCSESAFNGML